MNDTTMKKYKYAIEKDNFLKQKELIETVFNDFMTEKGYFVRINRDIDVKDLGYGGYATREDKFAVMFNLNEYCIPRSFYIDVVDINGSRVLVGETVATYSLSPKKSTSNEELVEKFKIMLNDVYEKYKIYSKENRLDFIFNELEQEKKDYTNIKLNKKNVHTSEIEKTAMNITSIRQALAEGKSLCDLNLKVATYAAISNRGQDRVKKLEKRINILNEQIVRMSKWYYVDNYIDSELISERVVKRQEFSRMLEDAKLGKFDLIITDNLAYFAKDIYEVKKYINLLLEYGVGILFIDDNVNTFNSDIGIKLTILTAMEDSERETYRKKMLSARKKLEQIEKSDKGKKID